MSDPNYHTVETNCPRCEGKGTGLDEDKTECPDCKGRGYLTREKADWERPRPSDDDADDLPTT